MINIRKMTQDDAPAVFAIEELVCVAPWTEKIFRDCVAVGYYCWVFVESDNVIGYGLFSEAAKEAHVLNIAIHPNWQRQGLGLRMMKHIIQEAKNVGADSMYLEVRASNQGAIALYRDLKFTEIGIRKDYYKTEESREDAIVFVLSLN